MLRPRACRHSSWLAPESCHLGSCHSPEPQPRLPPGLNYRAGSGPGVLPALALGQDLEKMFKNQGSLGGKAVNTEQVTHEGTLSLPWGTPSVPGGTPSVPGTPSPAPPLAWHPGHGGKLGTTTPAGRGGPRPTGPQVASQREGRLQGTPLTRAGAWETLGSHSGGRQLSSSETEMGHREHELQGRTPREGGGDEAAVDPGPTQTITTH